MKTISARELRIGNIVNIIGHASGIGISAIGISKFENGKIKVEPIPLTEDWILKFGFEKTNRIDFGELKPCFAKFSFALMIRHKSFFVDWIGGNTEIKYVHQLQNLYWCLCGEELKILNK